jgi:hypothetical protein
MPNYKGVFAVKGKKISMRIETKDMPMNTARYRAELCSQ